MGEINEISSAPVIPGIEQLHAIVLPDKKRVRISLVLNDAAARPTIEFTLLDEQKIEIARSTIIGVFTSTLSFTLHLGSHSADETLFLHTAVIINDNEIIDSRQVLVENNGF